MAKYGEACRAEGLRFCPAVVEAHGGWHQEGAEILSKISDALSKASGGERAEVKRHLFGRLAVLLQRDNATLLLNRLPTFTDPAVDGMV